MGSPALEEGANEGIMGSPALEEGARGGTMGSPVRTPRATSRRRRRALPAERLPAAGIAAAAKEGARGGTMGSSALNGVAELSVSR